MPAFLTSPTKGIAIVRQFPPSPITALIDGTPQYNLGESCGRNLAVAAFLTSDDMAALAELPIGYGTSTGDITLREQIAARHGVPSEQVLITAGAAAALFLVGLSFSDGEIVIGLPCYPPTRDIVHGLGATVRTVRASFHDHYRIDLDRLRDQLSPRTSLVIFASPQNPSGLPIPIADMSAILDLMSEVCPDAYLLIDETFREASYGPPPDASLAGTSPRLITCASLSKAYGVPGLRIGWLTTSDADLYENLRIAKFNAAIACGSVDEFLAERLLRRAGDILRQRAEPMATARDAVEAWIGANEGQVRWLRPENGAFCCAELNTDIFDLQAMQRLHDRLQHVGTSIAQGPWFGDAEQIIRIGLAYEPLDKLQKGLAALGSAMNDVRGGRR
jgi:aspartate/methionine/tyrosine aminotransferase